MAKFKAGDRAKTGFEAKRTSRRARPASAREPHKGAIRRIEDPPADQGRANLIFVDSGMAFRFSSDQNDLDPNPSPLPSGVMAYVQNLNAYAPALDDFYVDFIAGEYRRAMFNKTGVRLPATFLGTPYRFVETGMPLAARGVDVLALTLKIGPRAYPVKEGNGFRKAVAAERRLAAAMDASPPDAALIAALQKEVNESSFATGQNICRADIPDPLPNQFWFTHSLADQRDLWRDYGVFAPPVSVGSYKFSVDAPAHFEPFDPFDTENFKVCRRLTPDSEVATFDLGVEVPMPKLKLAARSKLVRVYLAPRLWHFVFNYSEYLVDVWQNLDDSTLTTFAGLISSENSGYCPAFSSPFCLEGWSTPPSDLFPTHPSYLFAKSDTAYDPADASDPSLLRLMTQLSDWWNKSEVFAPHVLDAGPYVSTSPGVNYVYVRTDRVARPDAVVAVTQDGCPAKSLVGGVSFSEADDDCYYVYRKTARTVESPATVYGGPFDHTGYSNASELPNFVYLMPTLPMSAHVDVDGPLPSLPDPRFSWTSGGLCEGDGLWPYMPRPHWLFG